MNSIGSQTLHSEWLIFYFSFALSCPNAVIDSIILNAPSKLRHQVISKWAALQFYPPILNQLVFLPKPACALDVPGPLLPWHFARKTAWDESIEIKFGHDYFYISVTHFDFPWSVTEKMLNPVFNIRFLGYMDYFEWKNIAEQLVTGHNAIGAIEQCLLDSLWKPSCLTNTWHRPGTGRTITLTTRVDDMSKKLFVLFNMDSYPLFASVVPHLTVCGNTYNSIPSFIEAFKREIRKFD